MAEVAIFHLLKMAAPFIQNEIKLLSGVRDEIVHIRDEFERMTAFLELVEANGEDQGTALKVCVRQVREASYEAGDVLEQFTLRLSRRNGDGIYRFLYKAYYDVMTLRVRHQVASKVQRIKLRLRDISEAYQRERQHNLLDMIAQGSGSLAVHQDSGDDAFFIKDHEIVGIEVPYSKIIEWLRNNDERLQMFSVVAMGGMGKTTLVRNVFDKMLATTNFETHVWIKVSKTYVVKELLKDIIRQLYEGVSKKVPEDVQNMDDTQILKSTINDFLKQKCYLLVVDNVWHNDAWEDLRHAFPDSKCGSRVLLTTRMEDVAISASKKCPGKVFHLSPLSDEKAWTLFCLKAFDKQACPSHLEGITREILKTCEGLPLAIVAIGGLLSTKDQGSINEWVNVYNTLGTKLEGKGKLESWQKILLLSYIDLPYHLKICFLYLSIYPMNYLIDYWRLVRLLIAEGFVQPMIGMTIEEVAGDYLMQLKDRSLILVEKLSMNTTVKAYHIHGMWLETIKPKSLKQNLVAIVGARQESIWPNNVRRLSIHGGFQNWQEIMHHTKQLRSLLIFGSIDDNSAKLLLASLKDGARLLKVLDFRGSPLTFLPKKTMKLPYLKYLSLRGTNIKEIPKSIGKLQLLETLDLKDTLVTVLPNEITKLPCLRHLLVYRYIQEQFYLPFHDQIGFRALKGIGNLTCLQKLCSIELNHGISDQTIIVEIGKLTQLKRINILKVKTVDGTKLCSTIEKLSDLRSLSIGMANEDEIINLDTLSLPPHRLQTLGLKGPLEKFPHWISSLNNISRLKLRYSKLREDPLKPLEDLPCLAELLLEHAYEGESLSFQAGGFPRLRKLTLDSLSKLRQVIVIKGAMPQLEKLHIVSCPELDELPSGIESLSCLRVLQLIDLSYVLISRLNPKLLSADYQRISHVSKVKVGKSTVGQWRQHHF